MQTPESMTTVNELKHRVDKLRTRDPGLRVIVYDERTEPEIEEKYRGVPGVILVEKGYL